MPGNNFFSPINFILQLKFKLLLKALATFSISGVQYADIKYARSLKVIYLHCTVTLAVELLWLLPVYSRIDHVAYSP